jgi:hypothetical protein
MKASRLLFSIVFLFSAFLVFYQKYSIQGTLSDTTGRAVFRIRRLNGQEVFLHQFAAGPRQTLARVGRLRRSARA